MHGCRLALEMALFDLLRARLILLGEEMWTIGVHVAGIRGIEYMLSAQYAIRDGEGYLCKLRKMPWAWLVGLWRQARWI